MLSSLDGMAHEQFVLVIITGVLLGPYYFKLQQFMAYSYSIQIERGILSEWGETRPKFNLYNFKN